jgi:putative intracellular protease/amidase
MTALKILIIVTSHSHMGETEEPTGLWLEELSTPYYVFKDAGAVVNIASIKGGPIPIDPRSMQQAGRNEPSVERALKDEEFQKIQASTARFQSPGLNDYDAIFLPGGHGTMWDLPASSALAQTVTDYITANKVVAAICHGPAGLVSARLPNGDPVIKGRTVTGFANSEEKAVGLEKAVPFLLEDRLKELGAHYTSGPDFASYVVRDGTLITGQNPASAKEAAELVLNALKT